MVPPSSAEAERSVLGAMLQDANAVLKAVEVLTPEDFYQPEHREIFSAMVEMARQQKPVDLVTVDAELTRRGTLEGVGGTGYLVDLTQFVPTTANTHAYIALVEEKSTLRRLIKASQEIAQECYTQQSTVPETLQHAEKAIFDIVMRRGGGDTLVPAVMSLVSMWAIRIPLALYLAPRIGLRGVWIGMAVELTARGVMFLIRLAQGKYADGNAARRGGKEHR